MGLAARLIDVTKLGERFGDALAIDGTTRLSYRGLAARTATMARALRDAGARVGDHVLVGLEIASDYGLPACLASLAVGAVPVYRTSDRARAFTGSIPVGAVRAMFIRSGAIGRVPILREQYPDSTLVVACGAPSADLPDVVAFDSLAPGEPVSLDASCSAQIGGLGEHGFGVLHVDELPLESLARATPPFSRIVPWSGEPPLGLKVAATWLALSRGARSEMSEAEPRSIESLAAPLPGGGLVALCRRSLLGRLLAFPANRLGSLPDCRALWIVDGAPPHELGAAFQQRFHAVLVTVPSSARDPLPPFSPARPLR